MSTVPNSYFASDGSSILLYFNSFPRTFAALSMIAMLPITNGRQQSWISSLNIVPTTISGPIPAGSPIVIAVIGLYCVLIILYFPFFFRFSFGFVFVSMSISYISFFVFAIVFITFLLYFHFLSFIFAFIIAFLLF